MRPWIACALLLVSATSLAQDDLLGLGQFPETRGLSGLPGGGFGILPTGLPSFRGAMSLSTPIAYSLDRWHWAAAISATSRGMDFAGLDTHRHGGSSSGTGAIMAGIPTDHGAITYSLMFISVHLDEVTQNLHFTPKQSGSVTWGVGVQDIYGTSETYRPREERSATSPYIVGTCSPAPGAFASLGYGSQRFGGIFGNLSATFGDWKALAEYDTYNWNYGVARNIGRVWGDRDRPVEGTVFVGYIRGKYATWSLALTF